MTIQHVSDLDADNLRAMVAHYGLAETLLALGSVCRENGRDLIGQSTGIMSAASLRADRWFAAAAYLDGVATLRGIEGLGGGS